MFENQTPGLSEVSPKSLGPGYMSRSDFFNRKALDLKRRPVFFHVCVKSGDVIRCRADLTLFHVPEDGFLQEGSETLPLPRTPCQIIQAEQGLAPRPALAGGLKHCHRRAGCRRKVALRDPRCLEQPAVAGQAGERHLLLFEKQIQSDPHHRQRAVDL